MSHPSTTIPGEEGHDKPKLSVPLAPLLRGSYSRPPSALHNLQKGGKEKLPNSSKWRLLYQTYVLFCCCCWGPVEDVCPERGEGGRLKLTGVQGFARVYASSIACRS
ncbi:UNVERIFIED_CONTAM: hypothetical protein K2H54_043641 [Gekko kuhli]